MCWDSSARAISMLRSMDYSPHSTAFCSNCDTFKFYTNYVGISKGQGMLTLHALADVK